MDDDKLTPEVAQETTQKPTPWTVMIFMIAEHVFEWADLSAEAQRTLDAVAKITLPPWLRIRVQLHNSEEVTRYARPGGCWEELVDEGDKDLTKGHALGKFISWALESTDHAEGDNSILVMWGHAYPFGVGFRDTGTGVAALDFAQLSAVLKGIQCKLKKQYPNWEEMKLDILGFDACDLATIELAQHFSPYAKYLVASQIPIPLPGWPYETILQQLIDSQADPRVRTPMTPSQFGSYVVRTFCGSYLGEENPVSLSLLSLEHVQAIFKQAQELAERLLLALDGDTTETDLVADLFDRSQTYRDKPFVDAADLCENLVRACNDSSVRQAAGTLGNLLTRPSHTIGMDEKVQNRKMQKRKGPLAVLAEDDGSPFILECGRNAHDTVKLHGVSLYAPNVALDSHDWRKASYWYAKFHGGSSSWSSLVEALSQRS